MHTPRHAFAFLSLALLYAPRCTCALRIAFIGDTGIGNDKPGSVWTDYLGNVRRPSYKVDGVECQTFDDKYCGAYSRAKDVFRLAADAGADLIVHAGDLDYASSPTSFFRFLTEHVWRRGISYIASKGNHDVDGWDGVSDLWSGPRGYQSLLRRQLPTLRGSTYSGSYGEDFIMETPDVLIVLSSVGAERPGESANRDHYDFLERALSSSKRKWKICVWHMTQERLQVSYKGDAVGFGAYEICRKYGAFIVTGHAHVYSRSFTMNCFGSKVYDFTREDLQVYDRETRRVLLRPSRASSNDGLTAVAVVGIGGYKNEAQLTDSGIWAKVYSTSCLASSPTCVRAPDASKFGALICDFDDASDRASCALRVVPYQGADDAAFRYRARAPDAVVDAFDLARVA